MQGCAILVYTVRNSAEGIRLGSRRAFVKRGQCGFRVDGCEILGVVKEAVQRRLQIEIVPYAIGIFPELLSRNMMHLKRRWQRSQHAIKA